MVIAVLVGPDDTLVREHLRELLRERDPNGENTTRLDGRSVKPGEVQTAAASAGFFGTGRVVVVDDLLARYAKGNAKSGIDWAGIFAAIPPENTLILVDQSLGSVPATVKKALPQGAKTFIGAPPRGRDLLQWMVRVAKDEGAVLGQREAQVLAEQLYPQSWSQEPRNPAYDRPPDLGLIRQEIARLALSAHPGPITRELILAETDRGDEDKIFAFLDAAIAGNLQKVIPELDRLLVAGVDPGQLLAQLAQNVELSAVIAGAGNRDPVMVGKDIGMSNPNRMSMVARSAEAAGPGGVRAAVRAVTAADRRIKRGELKDQVDGLYEVLAAIAAHRRTARR